MSFAVHDYEYIRCHMDEYTGVMSDVITDIVEHTPDKVWNGLPQVVREKGVLVAFYKYLLRHGMMTEPEHCRSCPFHEISFNALGEACDWCSINTEIFTGDMFFASHKERPDWCPLGKGI